MSFGYDFEDLEEQKFEYDGEIVYCKEEDYQTDKGMRRRVVLKIRPLDHDLRDEKGEEATYNIYAYVTNTDGTRVKRNSKWGAISAQFNKIGFRFGDSLETAEGKKFRFQRGTVRHSGFDYEGLTVPVLMLPDDYQYTGERRVVQRKPREGEPLPSSDPNRNNGTSAAVGVDPESLLLEAIKGQPTSAKLVDVVLNHEKARTNEKILADVVNGAEKSELLRSLLEKGKVKVEDGVYVAN